MNSALPLLFFDRELPVEFRDLVDGRAICLGPDDVDLTDAVAVIAGMRRWDAAAMSRGRSLRVISRTGVGYDTVDVAAATSLGITVCHAPEAPTVSTAEHTIALMMAITKNLSGAQTRAREGLTGGPATALELDGCVLGLLGFGRIARRVAALGAALGMKIVAHDPYLAADAGPAAGVTMVAVDELWPAADVVSLHAPATPATHHVINTRTLGMMRPGSYLVNCARGGLVDQDALLDALHSGRLAAAALDVTEPEPLPVGHPLLVHPRVVVTPHIASSTTAGRRRLYEHAIDNALRTLSGTPTNVVPEQR